MVFFLIFPLANGVFDWFSLSMTRWMMRKWVLCSGKTIRIFALYLFIAMVDFVVAALCVSFLAGMLTAGIAGLNVVLTFATKMATISKLFNWMTMMDGFRSDPLGDGLTVTLMLYSTLLPTIAHLVAGTASAFILPHLGRQYVVDKLALPTLAITQRVPVGLVMSVQWLISGVVWTVAVGMVVRLFLPMTWFGGLSDDAFLVWLPYKTAELVWTALGGG